MVRFLRTLAVVALLALAATTQADTYRSERVDCPVCEKRFTVQVVQSWTRGGRDGDLGPRVLGGAVLAHSVWTCPRCWYSAWGSDFPKGVKPETKKRILAELKPMEPMPPDANVFSIPAAVKFDLAARVLAWEGADAESRGRTFLNGAWAERQGGRQALRPVDSDEPLRARLTQALRDAWEAGQAAPIPQQRVLVTSLLRIEASAAAAERRALAARKDGTPDPILALAAAWLHRRTGEHARAAPFVEGLLADVALPASIRSAAQSLKVSMGRERALQERALPLLLEAARDPEVEGTSRTTLRISAADTLRRLGRPEDAIPLFVLAVQEVDVSAGAATIIRHGLVHCGALDGKRKRAVVAAEARARAALLDRLLSPETARGAARLIGAFGDPSFYPPLVAALSSKEVEVREAALNAFHRMERIPLPAEARLALEARVRDRREQERSRVRAISRLAREAHAASLPLFHEALSDPIERVQSEAIDGLARCGEEPEAQAMIALLEKEEGNPSHHLRRSRFLLALSALANRELRTVGAARAWWEGASVQRRETWVLEGFRATGKEIASLRGRAAMLVLLELLDHKDPWIRWNAVRALHEATEERFGWHRNLESWSTPGERRPLESIPRWAKAWRAWWAADGTHRPKWKSKR